MRKKIKKFNQCEIYLVIEDILNGSKIRKTFKSLKDIPDIFITKKHKRYAYIYFLYYTVKVIIIELKMVYCFKINCVI